MKRPFRAPSGYPVLLVLVLMGALPGMPVQAADGFRQVKSLLEMRQDRVVVQQWDLSCGAAALATLLNYQHGDPVSEREIAKGLIQREEYLDNPSLVRARQGFSLLDLKRYVEQRGYRGIGYGKLTLEDLTGTYHGARQVQRLQPLRGLPRRSRQSRAGG